jgi:hypothetical protein
VVAGGGERGGHDPSAASTGIGSPAGDLRADFHTDSYISLRYARAVPGRWAGPVEVRCEPAGERTAAEVVCDLTALVPAERPPLQEFAAGYAAFLGEQEREIAVALGRPC